MNCCGSKRKSWQTQAAFSGESPAPPTTPEPILFRYTGMRSLKVTGGISGRTYQFLSPGAEVLIDYRDVPGMAAVPFVEKV